MNNFNEQQIAEEEAMSPLEITPSEVETIAVHFNGRDEEGVPRSSATYSCYDFNTDDKDSIEVHDLDEPVFQLAYNKATGFYCLDITFNSCESQQLKLLWARLQSYNYNLAYTPEKEWVFFTQMSAQVAENDFVVCNIVNPLVFYLIRRVPNEDVPDYEVEPGVFTGGNTVRMLLHPDCVVFEAMSFDEDAQEDYPEE